MSVYVPQVASTRRPFFFWLISALTVSFLMAMIVAAPLASATGHTDFAHGIYGAFAMFCHQRPDRSYFIDGHKLAVCSRCTGLYAGFVVTVLLYPLLRSLKKVALPPRNFLMLAAVPLLIDFSLTFFGLWENTHTSRLLTGALLGSVAVFYVMPGLVELSLRSRPNREKKPNSPSFTLVSPESIAAAPSDYSAPERRI